jgi:hypothetical protein
MSFEEADADSEHINIFDTNLEEDQILEMLSKLRLEIVQIETTTGPSRRTICIRNETKRLESQLAYCKGQAKGLTDKVSHHKL